MSIEDNTGGNDNSQVSNTDEQTQTPNLGAIRKSGQQEVLNVLSKVTGQQFSNTQSAAAFIEQLVNQVQSGGNEQPTQQAQTKNTGNKSNSELAELRQMIQTLQSDLAKKDTQVRQTSLQSQIKDVAVKSGFDPSMLDISTNLFEQQIAFDESGNYYVKGKDGGVRLDANGNQMTLDQLAAEILKSRPKLGVEETRTGTGTKFGFNGARNNGEIPDAATDPAGWKAWKQANGIGGKSLGGVGVAVNKGMV